MTRSPVAALFLFGLVSCHAESAPLEPGPRIGPDGGVVDLPGVATFTFPAGLFAEPATVAVGTTPDAAADDRLASSMLLVSGSAAAGALIHLVVERPPVGAGTIHATIQVPADLVIPPGERPELLVLSDGEIESESLESFQLIPSIYREDAMTLELPVWALTDRWRGDGQLEAVLAIVSSAGFGNELGRLAAMAAPGPAATATECRAALIGTPVASGSPITSGYGLRDHPLKHVAKPHWGIDFGVPTGTPVLAAADGVIEVVKRDPKGYGLYVVVKHVGGAQTVYAHLASVGAAQGTKVKRGAEIARSDNSGGSTGPHLHFEYYPNGKYVNHKGSTDPQPCIQDATAMGAITVRDDGSLADDAFEVSIDGDVIGTTDVGQRNNFAVNNLIPGPHTLAVKGVVVPDNIGTYEVVLSEGVVFDDGTARRSGTVPTGGVASFAIRAP